MLFIGIDPGVHTGLAVYDSSAGKLITVKTLTIHQAMEEVLSYHSNREEEIFVRFEDARQRIWFGTAGREKLQGAGSIKRDSRIWEDFLTDKAIPFEAVAPKRNRTKIGTTIFRRITGWVGPTSEHARDAGMLVYGYNMAKRLK